MTSNLLTVPSTALATDINEDRRDARFDPYRTPKSEKARQVIEEITRRIQSCERYRGIRKRKRSAAAQAIFQETIAAVVCDMIHQYLIEPRRWTAVSLSKQVLGRKSRYRAPAMGTTLPTILNLLSAPEMGFVEMSKGKRSVYFEDDEGVHRLDGKQTTIRAGDLLVRWIEEYDLGFDDLGRSESEEVIILKAPKAQHWDKGQWIDYEDTPVTLRYREEVREINRGLEDADIALEQDPDDPVVDVHQRRLIRIFNNGSFDQGGRLFGGFWMNLKKEKRRRDLFIDGEEVIELDYGQMTLRMLYGLEGATPPDGDLYCIPGYELHRKGLKKIINSALFAEAPQTRMPQGARKLFPRHIEYLRLLDAVMDHHRPIAHHFFKGRGMELMFHESQVMVAVLMDLKRRGIVALPLHDGIIVPRSKEAPVRAAMQRAYRVYVGLDPVINVTAT